MRYSMLVYITKMSRTLLEAVQYLRANPEDELRAELLKNGRQMLAQIRAVLEDHRDDLHSETPLTQLAEIETLWEDTEGTLEERLEQFVQELPGAIFYQARAVFFAELGEKWDSMESVYTFMRDDPRFDPVVVRTPVWRSANRNGKQKLEIIYKDFLTPMGIPALGYDQYDIEADCPELAFISQPYEAATLEQFWPETIAKYARLVYLPYYLQDVVEETTLRALTQLPVYRCAWKTVCPTEKQLKYYRCHAVNQGGNALLTGLPKTDSLVTMSCQETPWPDGWQCLKGKTVFLWNSWYDAGVSSLRFFHELLGWFMSHKDCGLIWRPHPMTDAITKLHYPDQYLSYQKNLLQAKALDNVVVDRETSCAAAFSVSNALISDYSSLLPQYLLIDKPAAWIQGPAFHFTGEEFIESRWMERVESIEDVYAFMERIRKGKDRNAALRTTIRQRDLSLADGHCGERVCESVWYEMHREDFNTKLVGQCSDGNDTLQGGSAG